MNLGMSHGKEMTFEEHVEGYSDKEELVKYRRLVQISEMMQTGKTDEATICMIEEFQSAENAIYLFGLLREKIFAGWTPL